MVRGDVRRRQHPLRPGRPQRRGDLAHLAPPRLAPAAPWLGPGCHTGLLAWGPRGRLRLVAQGTPTRLAPRAAIAGPRGRPARPPSPWWCPRTTRAWPHGALLASGPRARWPRSPPARGLAAVTFLTTYRLAELTRRRALAARGRRPVSTPGARRRRAGRARHRPRAFHPVAEHPATESALVATYQEPRTAPCRARRGRRHLLSPPRSSASTERARPPGRPLERRGGPRWSPPPRWCGPVRPVDLGAVIVHLPQRARATVPPPPASRRRPARRHRVIVGVTGGITEADAEV